MSRGGDGNGNLTPRQLAAIQRRYDRELYNVDDATLPLSQPSQVPNQEATQLEHDELDDLVPAPEAAASQNSLQNSASFVENALQEDSAFVPEFASPSPTPSRDGSKSPDAKRQKLSDNGEVGWSQS